MDINLNNHLLMLNSITTYLKKNKIIWKTSETILEKYIEIIEKSAAEIDIEEQSLSVKKTILEITNCRLKYEISKEMTELDNALISFAEEIKDEKLIEIASTNKLDYMMLSNEEFIAKVNAHLSLFEKYCENLNCPGLIMDKSKALKEMLLNYCADEETLHDNTASDVQRKLEIESMKNVKKVDELMMNFQSSHSDFYSSYLLMRGI